MKYLLLFATMLSLTGCFWDSNIQTIAQNQMVQYQGNVVPNKEAEQLLENAFVNTNVPWNKDSVIKIARARNAIAGMGEYVKDRLNFDTALPYYTYKVWFEFTANQYMKLQVELDKRVAIEGAISPEGKVIYNFVKRDILAILEVQRLKIAATEKSINSKASQDTIQDMKNIYSTISPLIKMVL